LVAAGSATLSTGLYLPDGEQVVPVYAAAGDDADDVLVRAYNKCPTYERRLSKWYQTKEFTAKVAESAPLREHISSLMRGWAFSNGLNNDTSLINWYNVYDAFNVYYTSGYGNPMPPVNSTILSQVVALAHWLETKKSTSELAGNLLGGRVLADLLRDLTAVVMDLKAGLSNLRLKVVSGHYNTQLGVLAALRLDKLLPASDAARIPWLRSMPSTAAVLVFELHQSTADANHFAVRAMIQNGAMKNYTSVPLPCSSEEGARIAGAYACSLDAFTALLAPAVQEVGTAASWCSACAATAPLPCVVNSLKSAAANTAAMTPSNDTLIAVIVLLSVCLCGTLYFLYRARRKNVRYGTSEDAGLVVLSSASRIQ
jgi:hypothetical protein